MAHIHIELLICHFAEEEHFLTPTVLQDEIFYGGAAHLSVKIEDKCVGIILPNWVTVLKNINFLSILGEEVELFQANFVSIHLHLAKVLVIVILRFL